MTNRTVTPLFTEDLEHVLEHTRELWEEVRGRSIFVTGGTGFFGMWLVESFLYINRALSLGASICVLTRDPDAYRVKVPHLITDPSLSIHKGDVRVFEFPEGRHFDYIVHAGTTSSAPVEPIEMFTTIVDGTKRVLDFAKYTRTKKLLFVSSGAVYGKQPSEMTHIPEDYVGAPDVSQPTSAYGEGKRAGELLCAIASGNGLECKIARCFAFVGPHLPLDAHFAIGNFIRDAMAGGPIRIGGDGTPMRSYLYAADLAVWLWRVLFSGQPRVPYNIGSEHGVTIAEVARQVARGVPQPVRVSIALPSVAERAVGRYVPSTLRVKAELKLRETIYLQDAIQRTVLWHKS